jgi:hypothetical protein
MYSEPPWGEDGQSPSFDICACCGAEFGYEDCQLAAVRRYREQWLSGGAKWWDPKFEPEGWSLDEQLRNVPPEFR